MAVITFNYHHKKIIIIGCMQSRNNQRSYRCPPIEDSARKTLYPMFGRCRISGHASPSELIGNRFRCRVFEQVHARNISKSIFVSSPIQINRRSTLSNNEPERNKAKLSPFEAKDYLKVRLASSESAKPKAPNASCQSRTLLKSLLLRECAFQRRTTFPESRKYRRHSYREV